MLHERRTMKPEDALQELREMFPMTSREEQRVMQILERLWQTAQGVTHIAQMVGRVDPRAIRHTIPNAYV